MNIYFLRLPPTTLTQGCLREMTIHQACLPAELHVH